MRQLPVIICLGFLFPVASSASHLKAVEITARPVDCNNNVYEITISAYLSLSIVQFGGDNSQLDFGDGTVMIVPEVEGILIDAYNQVKLARFTINHAFPHQGRFVISYREFARNEGILNIDNSVNTFMYTETQINLGDDCNTTPEFLVPPVDRACSGKAFFHNPGARDVDGDSLSFALVPPRQGRDQLVLNYLLPNNSTFYQLAGRDYQTSNEAGDGPPVFVVDPVTGLVSWDAPGSPGEYVLALKITEWKYRYSDSAWIENGYVIRDMQVIVESCTNERPNLAWVQDYCVIAGEKIDFSISATDPDGHMVLLEAFSEALSSVENPATVDPAMAVFQSVTPPYDTAALRFRWQTGCEHVRDQPYRVTFKITDIPPSGPRLVNFRTVNIKVIAAAPDYESISVNPVSRHVLLQWKETPCANVQGYQVYRRVSKYNYDQPECENGMPAFLRYTFLGALPPDQLTFLDNDVAIGAMYCYRVVALIGSSNTQSRISLDTCLIPKPAEAPVLTEVSVQRTDQIDGEVTVRWTPPFDIDQTQYPPPYAYRVLRSMAGSENFQPVSEVLFDTVFTDNALNTEDVQYQYLIQLFVPALTNSPVDSSSIASSVFVSPMNFTQSIALSWKASTPWYNFLQEHPYHLIYRGADSVEDMVLIDSVDVNISGFYYEDLGQYGGQSLEPGVTYYYRVLTRGAYGNPAIVEPLENFSQVTGTRLLDQVAPCAPIVEIHRDDCFALPCPPGRYSNTLTFAVPGDECAEPGITYEIYYGTNPDDEFQLLDDTRSAQFSHDNLDSKAVCYRVIARDEAGNRSDYSETVCGDNCPYFALPNVFTPGNHDNRNDALVAFSSQSSDPVRCARFVKRVELNIFNRWGRIVHSTVVSDPETAILWDGFLANGSRASTGVYYYEAHITFEVRTQSERHQRIKGLIHVVDTLSPP